MLPGDTSAADQWPRFYRKGMVLRLSCPLESPGELFGTPLPPPPPARCRCIWSGYGLVEASVLPRWRSYKEALTTVGEWVCLVTCLVGGLPLVDRTKLSSAPSSSSPVQISWVNISSGGIFKRNKSVSPAGFVSNLPLLM